MDLHCSSFRFRALDCNVIAQVQPFEDIPKPSEERGLIISGFASKALKSGWPNVTRQIIKFPSWSVWGFFCLFFLNTLIISCYVIFPLSDLNLWEILCDSLTVHIGIIW